jgi:hypothetical protein
MIGCDWAATADNGLCADARFSKDYVNYTYRRPMTILHGAIIIGSRVEGPSSNLHPDLYGGT